MCIILVIALLLAISTSAHAQTNTANDYARDLRTAEQSLSTGDYHRVVTTLRDWPSRLPDRPEANHFIGLAFYRLADYGPAIYHLSAALKHETENSEPWKQTVEILGASYYFKNEWPRAVPLLEKAASWHPPNSDLQYTLAMSYLFSANTAGAREAFAKVYAVDAESPQAYILTADMMRKENVEAGVETLLEEARGRWPEFPGIAFRQGTVAINNGDQAKAATLFREDLKHNPSDSVAWHALGESLVAVGNSAEAAEAFKRSVWLDASATNSYVSLAKLYMDAANYTLAEDTLRQALKTNPQSYEANFLMGRLYHKTGRIELAKKQLAIADKIPH